MPELKEIQIQTFEQDVNNTITLTPSRLVVRITSQYVDVLTGTLLNCIIFKKIIVNGFNQTHLRKSVTLHFLVECKFLVNNTRLRTENFPAYRFFCYTLTVKLWVKSSDILKSYRILIFQNITLQNEYTDLFFGKSGSFLK